MAVLRKLLQLVLFLVVLQLGRPQSDSGTTSTNQELRRLTARVQALEGDVEEVKGSILGIMDILVSIKEDLVVLKEETNSTRQNTESALQDIQQSFLGLAGQCDTSSECYPLVSVQYLPTSCSDLATSSPSGYYWIHNYGVQVYCDFSVTSQQNPASSCEHLATNYSSTPSGYYWVRSSNGSAGNVYCDMARHCCGTTGGWMRVAYLDMTDSGQQCPEGFRLITEPKRTCELIDGGCTSIFYPSHQIQYSKVCGRVRAYQHTHTNAFRQYYYYSDGITIDSNYVDGMSVTHGESPRKHIWTFAAAREERRSDHYVCPCTKTDTPYTGSVPPFIGNDYFCDTASHSHEHRLYSEDPLWDGEGCGPTSSCCQFNSPPWFCKELPQPTTDDVEVRVCRHSSNANAPFELIELYIQ